MKTPTIKNLRQSGWKVRVMHTRPKQVKEEQLITSNFGGYTKVEVTTPDLAITVSGEAKCSCEDNYNRRIGNSIALGRAVEKLPEHYRNGVYVCNK